MLLAAKHFFGLTRIANFSVVTHQEYPLGLCGELRGADHLRRSLEEAQSIVGDALAGGCLIGPKFAPRGMLHQQPVSEANGRAWTPTNAIENLVRNKFGAGTMSKEACVGRPIDGFPTEIEGSDSLAELALNMRWSCYVCSR